YSGKSWRPVGVAPWPARRIGGGFPAAPHPPTFLAGRKGVSPRGPLGPFSPAQGVGGGGFPLTAGPGTGRNAVPAHRARSRRAPPLRQIGHPRSDRGLVEA